ncbi:MAG TPA: sugar diacid recognition domain-containing protein [Chondromyces sp.]|nr:sugar diacid recognition domain-containing protein [Chondromyces sp.]
MLEKVADKIATSTSQIIEYDVIITNEKGIIIGASNKERLHTFHEASIPVIKSKSPLTTRPGYIDHFVGTKPGFTLPIELQGNIIGTIAITGERSKVEKFGLLVKKHAEIMLREEILLESSLISQQAHQQFIKEVLAFDPHESSESILKARSFELGYELKPPIICVAVDIINFKNLVDQLSKSKFNDESLELGIQRIKLNILKEIQYIFDLKGDISAYIGEDKFIILHKAEVFNDRSYNNLSLTCNKLLKHLTSRNIEAVIGIGSVAETISEIKKSNREAWKVIEIGKKKKSTERVLTADEFLLESLLQDLNADTITMIKREIQPLMEMDDWLDIAQTIKAWCESGFNKVHTANSLHIHRNTLQYRLEKIKELTKINIKDYRKMMYLYLGILLIDLQTIKEQ